MDIRSATGRPAEDCSDRRLRLRVLVVLMYFAQRALLYPGAPARNFAPNGSAMGRVGRHRDADGETLRGALQPGRAPASRRCCSSSAMPTGSATTASCRSACRARHRPAGDFLSRLSGLDRLASEDRTADRRPGRVRLASARTRQPAIVRARAARLAAGVAVNTAARRPSGRRSSWSPPIYRYRAVAAARYPFLPVALLIKDRFRSRSQDQPTATAAEARSSMAERRRRHPAVRRARRCSRCHRCNLNAPSAVLTRLRTTTTSMSLLSADVRHSARSSRLRERCYSSNKPS